MKKPMTDLTYARSCACSGSNPDCTECYGRNVVSIGNILYSEMQIGAEYIVKMVEGNIGKCIFKKWDEQHLCITYFFFDGKGEMSIDSDSQTIAIRIDLLNKMRNMQSRYLEIDDFIGYLRYHRLLERYDLDTMANVVAAGLYNAVYCNCLRDHDRKYGTSLRSLAYTEPVASESPGERHYRALLRFVNQEIRSGITLMWAFRQFEKENGISVIEVLFESEKTLEQFMADAVMYARSYN